MGCYLLALETAAPYAIGMSTIRVYISHCVLAVGVGLLPLSDPLFTLLGDGETDSLALGEGDVRLVGLANDEHVAQTGGEGVVCKGYNENKLPMCINMSKFLLQRNLY